MYKQKSLVYDSILFWILFLLHCSLFSKFSTYQCPIKSSSSLGMIDPALYNAILLSFASGVNFATSLTSHSPFYLASNLFLPEYKDFFHHISRKPQSEIMPKMDLILFSPLNLVNLHHKFLWREDKFSSGLVFFTIKPSLQINFPDKNKNYKMFLSNGPQHRFLLNFINVHCACKIYKRSANYWCIYNLNEARCVQNHLRYLQNGN